MRLTPEEELMLAGHQGEATKKAMDIVVTLGKVYGAEELVPVTSVQVAGVSYGNLGEPGLEFIREWADQGARVRVPATLNPAGMDLEAWRELGIPDRYALQQDQVIKAYKAMGIAPACSCTPYLTGNQPVLGEHIAWSESSAVSYANSVLGARTNREGGPSALAAAIAGRTARYGLHLDDNRVAHHIVDLECAVQSVADFGALGYMIGKRLGGQVPYFRLGAGVRASMEGLKALGAAMAASGAVALYHVEGITPEARAGKVLADGAQVMDVKSLEEGYEALDGTARQIELVWIGCPHASLSEVEQLGELLAGRKLRAELWVTMARGVLTAASEKGLTDKISACGGRIVADACLIGMPVQDMGFTSIATNSAKGAFYVRSNLGLQVRFGDLRRCVEAAIQGRWPE
jgi:predicted aconitase